jgi:hypothetical protein
MGRASGRCLVGPLFAVAAIAVACSFPLSAAAEPFVAMRMGGSQGLSYSLADVERLTLDSSVLQVVTAGDADTYALESIVRIEFGLAVWTGVEHPEQGQDIARPLHMFQNHPNPFCQETRVAFELPQDGRVKLQVYSADGRLIRKLVDADRSAGSHSVPWDGLDESGRAVPSGVYFYMLAAPGVEESRKMILIR